MKNEIGKEVREMRETNPCAISSLRELEYEFAVINNMSSESKSPVCLNMNMGSYCERMKSF